MARHDRDLRQQTFRARFQQQRLETPRLGRRGRRSERRQPEVAPPLVVLAPVAQVAAFLDQAVREHAAECSVEVAGHQPLEAAAHLHFADERPAVPLAAGEREQHLKDERLQREVCVDVFAAGSDHGAENSIRMILVSNGDYVFRRKPPSMIVASAFRRRLRLPFRLKPGHVSGRCAGQAEGCGRRFNSGEPGAIPVTDSARGAAASPSLS